VPQILSVAATGSAAGSSGGQVHQIEQRLLIRWGNAGRSILSFTSHRLHYRIAVEATRDIDAVRPQHLRRQITSGSRIQPGMSRLPAAGLAADGRWPSSIDVAAMTDLEDRDDTASVVDQIDDSVVAVADAIPVIVTCQLLRAARARICRQSLNLRNDALAIGS